MLSGDRYARDPDNEDCRFSDSFGAIQSIVTSSGQSDSGLFETNLRDERYLPFEGCGVISEWRIALPRDFRQFDYDTISDVILHIRYTAREGGDPLRAGAIHRLKQLVNDAQAAGCARLFSILASYSNRSGRGSRTRRQKKANVTSWRSRCARNITRSEPGMLEQGNARGHSGATSKIPLLPLWWFTTKSMTRTQSLATLNRLRLRPWKWIPPGKIVDRFIERSSGRDCVAEKAKTKGSNCILAIRKSKTCGLKSLGVANSE